MTYCESAYFETRSMEVLVNKFGKVTEWNIRFPDGSEFYKIKLTDKSLKDLTNKICERIWAYVPNESIEIHTNY